MTRFFKDYSPYIIACAALMWGAVSSTARGSIDSLTSQVQSNTKHVTICKVERAEVQSNINHIRENIADMKKQIESMDNKLDQLLINGRRNR